MNKITLYIYPQRNSRYAALAAYLEQVPQQKRHEVLRLLLGKGIEHTGNTVGTIIENALNQELDDKEAYQHIENQLIVDETQDENRIRHDIYLHQHVPSHTKITEFVRDITARTAPKLGTFWNGKTRQLVLRTLVVAGYEDKDYRDFVRNLYVE